MRASIVSAVSALSRLFASEKSTWLARNLIVALLGMILMAVLMSGMLDVTRAVHPVAHIAAFFTHDAHEPAPDASPATP